MSHKFFAKKIHIVIIILFVAFLFNCCKQTKTDFVTTKDGIFYLQGNVYYFIGANFWYGSILGSETEHGNRQRLLKELDFLKSKGITNLRILVGADLADNHPKRVSPALQTKPGVYNEKMLEGLDYLLVELSNRNMKAVLYLGNSWDWSGGYGQYLEWNGYGPSPSVVDTSVSWPEFQAYTTQFHSCKPCIEQYLAHIKKIVSNKNSITGLPYVDDPAIMAWQLGNEPRAFSDKAIPDFEHNIKTAANLIKSLDKNHLVSIGSEGKMGSEGSMELYERLHSVDEIDYLTIHIWPKNWRWIDEKNLNNTVNTAIKNTVEYIDIHLAVAKKLGKPLVVEEFGFPRDGHSFSPLSATTNRDKYYDAIFQKVLVSSKNKENLAGCNFWSYGGFGRPGTKNAPWFSQYDDLLGDPPCEEQGLNSVFDTDSIINIIEKYNKTIQNQ